MEKYGLAVIVAAFVVWLLAEGRLREYIGFAIPGIKNA